MTVDVEAETSSPISATSGPAPKVPRWRRHLASTVFRTNVYHASLRRGGDPKIVCTPHSVVPGSATKANAMFQGRYTFGGHTVENATEAPWRQTDLAPSWMRHCHEFAWLADFATADGATARRQTRELIRRWALDFGRWTPAAWRPDILGLRLVSWLTHADFLLIDAEPDFGETFMRLIGEHYRHLGHAQGLAESAPQRCVARASFLTASFALGRRLATYDRQIDRLITEARPIAEGHATRSPSQWLRILPSLLVARDALRDAGKPHVALLDDSIDRLGAALRLVTHGDGGLAVFHGGNEEDPEVVATVVARTKKTTSSDASGYTRLQQGRLRLIAETTGPVLLDDEGFASTLAIEVSIGRERLFVNCGCPDDVRGAWRDASRATAAHSALVIDDRNQERTGATATGPNVLRGDEGDNTWLEIATSSYANVFGLWTTRRFHIAKDGHELVGEERVHETGSTSTGATPQNLVGRYHLHPNVTATRLGDGRQILLRLGNGTGWIFEAAEGTTEIEESIYFGEGGKPRRTKQIVVTRPFENKNSRFVWHLMRMDGRT
ncbi:MAG: heparinase II/III family protein [Alphaproteobacteria bacterium]